MGAELIEKLQPLSELAPFIRHHHERFDGHGYPEQLSGERIPLDFAIGNLQRIVAAVDLPVSIDLESGYGEKPDDVAAGQR